MKQFPELFSKVERAKQEWERMVDSLPELILMVGPDQEIVRTNRTIERWRLGSVKSVKGKNIHDLLHPHCQDEQCYIFSLLQKDDPVTDQGELREIEIFDPELGRHLIIKVCPIPDTAGVCRETAVIINHLAETKHELLPADNHAIIIHDMSEQKRLITALQSSTQRLNIMNQISRAILSGQSLEHIAGITLTQLQMLISINQANIFLHDTGQNHFYVIAAAGTPNVLINTGQIMPRFFTETSEKRPFNTFFTVPDTTKVKNPSLLDNSWRLVDVCSYVNVPLYIEDAWLGMIVLGSPQIDGFAAADLSIIKEVGELLSVAINQYRLARQLQQSNNELKQMLRDKQEMMANLSHELRSPLVLIKGFVDVIRDGTLGSLNDKQREALSIVNAKSDQLDRLISRLLILQTIDERTLDREPVHPEAYLNEIVIPWQLPAGNHHIQLELEVDASLPLISIDKYLFEQVIANLIDNAIKFSPHNSQIIIKAGREDDDLIITVSDEGAGIAPERLHSILERFEQENKQSRALGGVGIGLALCREIVRVHGGAITAASPGKNMGSTFTIRLPF